MRKRLVLSISVLFSSFFCFGQLHTGNSFFSYRIGVGGSNGNANIIPTALYSDYTDKGSVITNEVSFGWVKKNNLLVSAGLGLSSSFIHLENKAGDIRKGTGLSFYPFILLQKNFVFKCGKVSFSPNALAGVAFLHETIYSSSDPNSAIVQSNSFNSGFLKLRPISFSFLFTNKFHLGADVGEYVIHSGSFKANQVNNSGSQLKEKSLQTNAGLDFNIILRASFLF